jgi:hypothetical protein
MAGRMAGWPSLSLTTGCALLTAILLVAYSLVCGFAWTRGDEALQAAVLASVVCGIGAIMALVVTGLTKGSVNAPVGILGGMMVGMGLPLAMAAAFGFNGWLVICFEIALVFQTLIGVAVVGGRKHVAGKVAASHGTQGVS